MELKEVKRETKNVTMTIRTSKAKSEWMKKNDISPALLFNKALEELMENMGSKKQN